MSIVDDARRRKCLELELEGSVAQEGPRRSRAALLMSIRPQFSEAILAGAKTVELRRKAPKHCPATVVIYGSGHLKAVVGVADLVAIHTSSPSEIWEKFGPSTGLNRADFDDYFSGSEEASALMLADAKRADDSISLSKLRALGLEPPQSWRYVDQEQLLSLNEDLFVDHVRTVAECGHGASLAGVLQDAVTGIRHLVEKRPEELSVGPLFPRPIPGAAISPTAMRTLCSRVLS